MLDFAQILREDEPLIHLTCVVKDGIFGRCAELGDHCIVTESVIGDYTYLFARNDVYCTELGKFNSIAAGVRIDPMQHPMRERLVDVNDVSAFVRKYDRYMTQGAVAERIFHARSNKLLAGIV